MDLVTAVYKVSAFFPKEELYGLTSSYAEQPSRCPVILRRDKAVVVRLSSGIFCARPAVP